MKVTSTPEYQVWRSMKKRCHLQSSKDYPNYGGMGVKVCDRWRNSFLDFVEDIGWRPTPKHSIDRINPRGNYEPSNVRWATLEEQANNRTNHVKITIGGVTKNAATWEKIAGLSHGVVNHRFKAGWPAESLLSPITK